jgi:hypothetical protein
MVSGTRNREQPAFPMATQEQAKMERRRRANTEKTESCPKEEEEKAINDAFTRALALDL